MSNILNEKIEDLSTAIEAIDKLITDHGMKKLLPIYHSLIVERKGLIINKNANYEAKHSFRRS